MAKNKYKIPKTRILEISNDITEDMCEASSVSKAELIEVVRYFRDMADKNWQESLMRRDAGLLKITKEFCKLRDAISKSDNR